ncbi:hypothetical protein [Chitinophaga caseinilytica]|uniref:Cytochrome B n=1 Tax=Chitinophaga caseinilytica TaxID=2267521 RepID=A0ABZ2ZA90_9BACT
MNALLDIHSYVRWLIVIFGALAVIRAIAGVAGKKPYGAGDAKAGLFFMIFLDIQLLIGLVLMFTSSLTKSAFGNMGAAMGDKVLRFFTVEHTLLAIVAIAMVHIGRSKIKKADSDAKKQKTALIFFTIAFVLLLALIPWPGRELIGRALLPSLR